jgi:PIN domain nuclease of toxin-antitoxin system
VILVDTHVAIWILRNDATLGKKARNLAVAALDAGQLIISAVSFWEIALLIAKARLRSLDDPSETRVLDDAGGHSRSTIDRGHRN